MAKKSTLHLIGLLSDGNVHSHINHVKALIIDAKKRGVAKVAVHALLDGRDVGETSALDYTEPFEAWLASVDPNYGIASGGGRMQITMDRYSADWTMVERGWHTHVLGEGRLFPSASAAVKVFRAEKHVIDQDLPAFVVERGGKPFAPIVDGDAVVFFNFRGDRAVEISKAFVDTKPDGVPFDRVRQPTVCFAGMMTYDGDTNLPPRILVTPPAIDRTLGQYLVGSGVRQLACSETQKYGHVTYFWNGNRSGKFEGETYQEVLSDVVPFEQRPWMKAAEIADAMIEALKSGKYRTLRCNFANGDMVGHTGNFRAATMAVEAVDLELARILPVIDAMGGVALITADHGNADEMYELDKKTRLPAQNTDGSFKAKTAHTLNPVPLILYDNITGGKLGLKPLPTAGLSNIAATTANLLGLEKHAKWDESLLEIK